MKNIIITGSNGLVATEVINLLSRQKEEYKIFAVTTNIDRLSKFYSGEKGVVCTTLDRLKEDVKREKIDIVLHCAFARNSNGEGIARSLDFTHTIAQIARDIKAKLFINISSQSVYDKNIPPFWTESTPTAPDYPYAVGKYASELIVESILAENTTKYTNIRLSSICQNARFLNVFVKNALSGQPIHVQGGSQLCSFIDVRDVADALKLVIDCKERSSLSTIYNLGRGDNITIRELASLVRECNLRLYNRDVKIDTVPQEVHLEVGMDNSLFCETFKWKPAKTYNDMILSIYSLYN